MPSRLMAGWLTGSLWMHSLPWTVQECPRQWHKIRPVWNYCSNLSDLPNRLKTRFSWVVYALSIVLL